MDNEFNKINYRNDISTADHEYREYNEYNNSKFSNRDYEEMSSYEEVNAGKKTVTKLTKIPNIIFRLIPSAVVLTVAIVGGSSLISKPTSEIKDVYLDGYGNNLFVGVEFSAYNEEDNLELVVKNDFTNRSYKIEPYEEHPQEQELEEDLLYEEQIYYYQAEVLDLSYNSTYTVKIVSGANVLYYETYKTPKESLLTTTNFSDGIFEINDQLIYASLTFSSYNPDDDITLELVMDGVTYESIPITSLEMQESYYYYSNSFSVVDEGEYIVNLYINNELVKTQSLIYEAYNPSVVSDVSYEYSNSELTYHVSFSYYNTDTSLIIKLFNANNEEVYTSDIYLNQSDNPNMYTSSVNINSGAYELVIMEDEISIYTKQIVLEAIAPINTSVLEINHEYVDNTLYCYVVFENYSSDETIKAILRQNDNIIDSLELSVSELQAETQFAKVAEGTYTIQITANEEIVGTTQVELVEEKVTTISDITSELINGTLSIHIIFSDYNENDEVVVKLMKDSSLVNSSVVANITNLESDVSMSEVSEDSYTITASVGSEDIFTKQVSLVDLIQDFSYEYNNRTFYYFVSLSNYDQDYAYTIYLMENSIISHETTIDLVLDNGVYSASGEISNVDIGEYDYVLMATHLTTSENRDFISQNIKLLGPTSIVNYINHQYADSSLNYEIYFDEFAASEDVTVKLLAADTYEEISSQVITQIASSLYNSSFSDVSDGNYYISVTAYYYDEENNILEEEIYSYPVEIYTIQSIFNSIVYVNDDYAFFDINFEEYDASEAISVVVSDNNGNSTSSLVTISEFASNTAIQYRGYAYVSGLSDINSCSYAFMINNKHKTNEGTLSAYSGPIDLTVSNIIINNSEFSEQKVITGTLSSDVYPSTIRLIGDGYDEEIELSEYMIDESAFEFNVPELAVGEYRFLIVGHNSDDVKLIHYDTFTIN